MQPATSEAGRDLGILTTNRLVTKVQIGDVNCLGKSTPFQQPGGRSRGFESKTGMRGVEVQEILSRLCDELSLRRSWALFTFDSLTKIHQVP